jgi:hypothetical protein
MGSKRILLGEIGPMHGCQWVFGFCLTECLLASTEYSEDNGSLLDPAFVGFLAIERNNLNFAVSPFR